MTEWQHILSIPGPPSEVDLGNFPVTIQYSTPNLFQIISGTPSLQEDDIITLTLSPIDGVYTVTAGVNSFNVPVTPAIPFFSSISTAVINIVRPVATYTETEIEEPVGFNDIVFNVLRDELWHGVFFEASLSQLGFHGEAFDILHDAKESDGVDAYVIYTVRGRCEGETTFTDVISGKLNFAQYQETCGDQCLVRMAVEQDNCAIVFKNRFDQKVDIDTPLGFDKKTNLVDYPGIGFTMQLATQIIPISSEANVAFSGDETDIAGQIFSFVDRNLLVRPIYTRVLDNSIKQGYLDDPSNIFQDPGNNFLLTPQLLLEDNQLCINDPFVYTIKLKGRLRMNVNSTVGTNFVTPFAVVDYWNGVGSHTGPGNLTGNAIMLHMDTIAPGILSGITYEFDYTYSGSVALPVGYGLYAYIKFFDAIGVDGDSLDGDFHVEFDPETYFYLYNIRTCPPTDCTVYLIHETLARVTEVMTNRCLTVESEYYGRTDSQPYSFDDDGCGGLRVLTPGLRIRQATDKNFFASMKELMLGLRGIDNIGMGMYSDRIRIEPARWFYQDVEIFEALLIPQATSKIDDRLVYSNIKYGYNKWEIKSIKGLDEFNSYKERRTGIESLSNELDISSDLIAGGYVIENLRTSTLADTGQTDNTYDNDVFIICVQRSGYDYIVEQNVTESAANFFSPTTAYNWRIRPLSNMLRWFKSIAQAYVNLSNTASKIFFTSGKGNYKSEGKLAPYDPCVIENKVLAEDADISINDFENISDATPIYKPETITFTYPLSIADYQAIKANPYGYVSVQCGVAGPVIKAYIKSIQYKVAEGQAEFILLKAWL